MRISITLVLWLASLIILFGGIFNPEVFDNIGWIYLENSMLLMVIAINWKQILYSD